MIRCLVRFATRTIRHEKRFSRFEDLERTIEVAIESPFYFFFANTFMHSCNISACIVDLMENIVDICYSEIYRHL